MKRIAEPELMDSEDQVRAYAEADFEDSYSLFIRIFDDAFGIDNVSGYVLDLGCGPAEISIRFARTYPHTILHGVDGSEMMLKYGTDTIERIGIQSRVKLVRGMISRAPLPRLQYDAVVCNSLLHHLSDPRLLWITIKQYTCPGAPVLMMDLIRPKTFAQARGLVEKYTGNEPSILKKDFLRSLMAAYRPEEVALQLMEAQLHHFELQVVSDRHLAVFDKI